MSSHRCLSGDTQWMCRQGRVAVVRHKLSLRGLFVLGVPHASLGVVVVKKVAQAESLNLQAVLQDPAWREGGRKNWLKSVLLL